MKRIVTLLAVLTLTCVGTLQAQVLKKSTAKRTVTTNAQRATIAAGENQQWWGYIQEDDALSMIGIGKAATYHCAFYLPGNHDVASGKKLCAVRFALMATHASDVKVWTASALPSGELTTSNTLWMTDVAQVEQEGFTDVALTTPYEIPAEGVYVGYSFTITSASTSEDQYPIVIGGADQVNGLLLRTNDASWYDYYGEGFGVLATQVLLEGSFPDYSVKPAAAQSSYYAQVNETADVDITLTNNGQVAVNSVSYTITADGVTGEEQTVTLKTPIKRYNSGQMTITVGAAATASSSVKTLTVTKVNGEANQAVNSSTDFTLYTMDRLIARNVVVEEFTGTGCGYCPRGLVGMEKLRETFGDRFIGIGIHQYNTGDAMYIADYPSLNWSGAPSCRIDRGDVMDPYYGSNNDICDDFRAELAQPAMVSVDVEGTMDEGMTEVAATAYVEPLFDTNEYTLELALVADGLTGTTSAWWQSNYYSGYGASTQPADLAIFCSGGKYGSNSVKGFSFNDVAVGTSYKNKVNQVEALGDLTAGLQHKVSYTLSMPTKATLRNALKKGTIYVVALVIGKDGRIANAAKREVGEQITGVSTVRSANAEAASNYSLNGMLLTAPQRGINIVRMTDGTVRKVVVK